MGRKSTLKVNKLPEKKPEPFHCYIVCVKVEGSEKAYAGVEVIAHDCVEEGDDLKFYNFYLNKNGEEIEELVACFKEWMYFIRKDADLAQSALEWGNKFESLAKHDPI